MTGLWIVGLVVLLLVFLGLIRVGGEAEYSEKGLFVRLKVGVFSFLIFPFPVPKGKKEGKKEKKRGKKEKSTKSASPEEKPSGKKGGSLSRLRHYLPLVGEAAGGLKRRIRIDVLELELLIAASDAAAAAMAYGYANMILGIVWPLLEENFEIRDHRIQTEVDFEGSIPTVYLKAAFSARIGQLISFGCHLLWHFLKLYRQEKREKMQKEAI